MAESSKTPTMQVDIKLVRQLAELLNETGLSEIAVEDDARKIRVSRTLTVAGPAHVLASPAPALAVSATVPAPAADAAPALSPNAIKSPMVGTCYLAADPEAAPFASVGSTVAPGDTIIIIEAMKVMNPITAPKGGILSAVLVTNGQPVEFDQPLFVID
jgi:acetyl-CoA carboxylase biotin carboxyl carrier protein